MNKTKLPNLIPILILTLVTVVMWVSLDIYIAIKKPSNAVVPAQISQPLTPTLDQNTINQIESHTFLNDSQIPDNVISSSPTPIPTQMPTPTTQPTSLPVSASSSAATP